MGGAGVEGVIRTKGNTGSTREFKMGELHVFPVDRLSEAFTGHRCVTAWLGYGTVLFLGFGETVLPIRDKDGRHTQPSFELETNFSDWRINGPINAWSGNSNREVLIAAAESLIGEAILSGEVGQRKRLAISFTGGKSLFIESWNSTPDLADAWSLKSPDGRILAMATDGRFVVVDASVPVRDWFAK